MLRPLRQGIRCVRKQHYIPRVSITWPPPPELPTIVPGERKELPAEISRLTNLTSLDLSSNKLTQLPPEISRLTQLTSLALSVNKLTTAA